ncbi:MAG: glycosyltransferase [Deltaproteobacteria bacterium]|nr:glycosyltransferase [Deltaproteobacteria bacterium]
MTDIAIYGFRPGPGGIPHVIRNLTRQMVAAGIRVDLLLHHQAHSTELPSGVSCRQLAGNSFPQRILALHNYLRETQPRVLLTNREPANRAALLALLLLPQALRPRFVPRVGMAVASALERRSWWKRRLRRESMRFCYRAADMVIANAGDVARDLQEKIGVPAAKLRILPNPTIDSELFQKAACEPEHPWLRQGSLPVLMAVGRLARQKDYPTLLKAFARLHREYGYRARLIILGEGGERPRLEKMIADLRITGRVALPGYVDNPFAWMARADLFALSSAWEGSPNVLIEALALGLPCVATDCPGGSREILDRGRYGRLVKVGNDRELALALRLTLENPLPAASLQAAVERFKSEHAAQEYLRVLLPENFTLRMKPSRPETTTT